MSITFNFKTESKKLLTFSIRFKPHQTQIQLLKFNTIIYRHTLTFSQEQVMDTKWQDVLYKSMITIQLLHGE